MKTIQEIMVAFRDEVIDRANKSATGTVNRLFDEMICPMCYRLNPQHKSMDYGAGCHWCQDREEWLEEFKKGGN